MQVAQSWANVPIILFDEGWAAQMPLFHCHPTAAIANVFHGSQFIFADVLGFHFRRAAETALRFIPARVAQVPRGFGDGTAAFTGIGHGNTPFSSW